MEPFAVKHRVKIISRRVSVVLKRTVGLNSTPTPQLVSELVIFTANFSISYTHYAKFQILLNNVVSFNGTN